MKAIWTAEAGRVPRRATSTSTRSSRGRSRCRSRTRRSTWAARSRAARAARVRYGDGWIPILGRGDGDIVEHLPALREEAAKLGRSLDGFEVSAYGVPPDGERLRALRDAGVARALFFMPPAPKDEALKVLDSYAAVIQKAA